MKSSLQITFIALVVILGARVEHAMASEPRAVAGRVLITGSNRGIGFALTKEFTRRGWQVIATCRDPEHATELRAFAASHSGVVIERLDVSNNTSIDRLAAMYKGEPIDVLINNAGVGGGLAAERLAALDAAAFTSEMRTNAYAPLRVSQAFLDSVARSKQKKIIGITSGFGSLSHGLEHRDLYFYAMSKSALNMALRMLQGEVGNRGILVGIIAPGHVDTDLQRRYQHDAAANGTPVSVTAISAAESAKKVADYIVGLDPKHAGRFFNYDGEEIPW